ncbi:hypothetical protein [Pseudomonas grimontii]|uniref:hypothetical protein n=1 Tax=Pseudomonas grimontii TaxID=129847 RepID=UPI00387B0C7C
MFAEFEQPSHDATRLPTPAEATFRDFRNGEADNAYWLKAMDALQKEEGWNDTQLGKRIGLSVSMVHQCRTHVRPLPPAARVRIIAALGVELTKAHLITTLPLPVRRAIEETDAKASFLRSTLLYTFFDKLDSGSAQANQVERFFDGLCSIAGCSIDDLAKGIGISPAVVARVVCGDESLPFRSKVAIADLFPMYKVGPLLNSIC